MMDTDTSVVQERIGQLCHQFKLPTMGAQSVDRFTASGHGDALPIFLEVLEQEADDRRHRRINRLRQASKLPSGKTWETFEHQRMPLALRQQLDHLAQGSFVEHGVNVLAFGLPGTGKTHALCALGHRLVEAGHSVLFAPAYLLVQELLAAKRDLDLPRRLRKLDNFDFLLLNRSGKSWAPCPRDSRGCSPRCCGVRRVAHDHGQERKRRPFPRGAGPSRAGGTVRSIPKRRPTHRVFRLAPRTAARWISQSIAAASLEAVVREPASRGRAATAAPVAGCRRPERQRRVRVAGSQQPDRDAQHLPGAGAGHPGRHIRGSIIANPCTHWNRTSECNQGRLDRGASVHAPLKAD